MREKVLLVGEPNTSKTLSLVSLALIYPNSNVVILDPDNGTEKLLKELELEDLNNLNIIPVTSDWEDMMKQYKTIKGVLKEGDWLCFDMLGRFWDLVQEYYSAYVFGESPIQHLMTLKSQAKSVAFGGFEGLTDWPLIKRLHSEIIDEAVVRSKFNVVATTAASKPLAIGGKKASEIEGIYASEFSIKPEGEKHNIYRFDTQAVLYRKKEGTYHFRLVRDRGRQLDLKREFDITGKNFWEVYKEYRGL